MNLYDSYSFRNNKGIDVLTKRGHQYGVRALRGACRGGYKVDALLEKYYNKDLFIKEMYMGGHNNYKFEKGPKKYDPLIENALEGACEGGHYELVDQLINYRIELFDLGLLGACKGGHMDLVKLMISKLDNNHNCYNGIISACEGGHIDIVQYLSSLLVSRYHYNHHYQLCLYGACKSGSIELVLFLIDRGANDYNNGLQGACEGSHLNIMGLMIQRGANNWLYGLIGACKGGHINIIKLMAMLNNFLNFLDVIEIADTYDNYYIMKLLNLIFKDSITDVIYFKLVLCIYTLYKLILPVNCDIEKDIKY